MKPSSRRPLNLAAVARRAMTENRLLADFPAALMAKANSPADLNDPAIVDESDQLWSSVDNHDSEDLDQLELVQRLSNGKLRLKVAIADVDAWVAKNSAVDNHAGVNTSSVYTGVTTFPMLPDQYSSQLTSLLAGQVRLAIVIDMTIGANGDTLQYNIYRAKVRNQAKLVYDDVNRWYSEGTAYPAIDSLPGLAEQVRLQFELAERLQTHSKVNGALDFATIEAVPQTNGGKVVGLKVTESNAARDLIKHFMVAANNAMALFLEKKDVAFIRRIVKTPEKWDRIVEIAAQHGTKLPKLPDPHKLADFLDAQRLKDPEHFPDLSVSIVKLLGKGEYVVRTQGAASVGHFGLGLHDYTHFTAPNRRYIDLVLQRILKAVISGKRPPYTVDELSKITAHCMDQEHAVRKIERRMRKVAAAMLLRDRVGEVFECIVTGVTDKGTFVRVTNPPAEGRLLQGQKNLGVADKIKARLKSVNEEQGFLDFEQVGRPLRKWKS